MVFMMALLVSLVINILFFESEEPVCTFEQVCNETCYGDECSGNQNWWICIKHDEFNALTMLNYVSKWWNLYSKSGNITCVEGEEVCEEEDLGNGFLASVISALIGLPIVGTMHIVFSWLRQVAICISITEFCIMNGEFVLKMMNFSSNMMDVFI